MPFKGLSIYRGSAIPGDSIIRVTLSAIFLTIFLTISMACSPAQAQNRVLNAAALNDTTHSLKLGQYTIIQDDKDNKITADTIRASNGAVLNGKLSKQNSIYLGSSGTSAWLSVKLLNQGQQNDWVLDIGRRIDGRIGPISSLSVFELTVGEPDSAGSASIEITERKAPQDKGVYKIQMERGQQKLILLSVKTRPGSPVVIPLKIYSEDAYLAHVQKHAMIITLYALVLGLFALIFIASALSRNKNSQIVYGAYFAFAIIAWLAYDYFGAMIGTENLSYFSVFRMLGFSLFAIFMTKVFCNIEYSSFTEKYILYAMISVNVLLALLCMALPSSMSSLRPLLINSGPISTFSVVCLMALAQAKNGQLPSLRYFISWLLPLVGLCITVASLSGYLPQEPYLLSMFWYSLPVQGVFLGLAVRQKIVYGGDEDTSGEVLNLNRLKETKDTADHSRLLKVIEKEREMLAEFRTKEAGRTEDMRIAKEAADEANRAKSAFLAVVSHEIRTPMTGVMGMVRLLMDSNINKQQRDYVMAIQESSDAMLALLNDILDFEKIQQGRIEMENISFDLHRMIQGVVTLMSGHATEKGVTLSARMDDDLPKFVKGDPTRLRQVLLNLMGNAIKFTSKGGVNLYVKNLNPTEQIEPIGRTGKYMIYFGIQDTGIGISAEGQKNLFNPFSQANSSISRKFGGTGLGLAISKGLIERMGSSININSKEGEGSTFFFTLDMDKGLAISHEQPKRSAGEIAQQKPVKPLRMIVVDDNSITRKVIAGFLEPLGHEIVGVGSAEEALSKIYAHDFDMALMDIELPGMRGNEATKLLREYGDQHKAQIPVIAMTGNIGKEDMQSYLVDGMNGFIAKPIDPDKLKQIVNEIAHKTFEREIKAPGSAAPMPRFEQVIKPQDPAPKPEPVEIDTGVFNPDMLQSLKDTIGANSLNELLVDLLVKTEEILVAMDFAVQTGNLDALAARAHELKGMAGNFGLVEISAIAAQAEKKAKSLETEGLPGLVGTLPEASTRAKAALKNWVAQ